MSHTEEKTGSAAAEVQAVPSGVANLLDGVQQQQSPEDRDQLAQQLVEVMAMIHRRGWCDGTGGNFSCVMQREPLLLLMAPSGVDKGNVSTEALIAVDGKGSVVGGLGRASAETLLHLAIVMEARAGAVLHTHSQAATLLSQWVSKNAAVKSLQNDQDAQIEVEHLTIKGLEMLKGLEGVTTHETSVHIPILANDQDLRRLSDKARPCIASAPHGLLIAGHGLYAWGNDLPSARRHLEILEFLLEQRWRELLLERLCGVDNHSWNKDQQD